MEGNANSKSKARLIVLAVFAIGFSAGALSMNLYERFNPTNPPSGRPTTEAIVGHLDSSLSLSREQRERIKAILDDTFNQYKDKRKELEPLYKQIEPQFADIRQKSRDRIRAELTEEQLPKFEELVNEQDRKHDEHRQSQKK